MTRVHNGYSSAEWDSAVDPDGLTEDRPSTVAHPLSTMKQKMPRNGAIGDEATV